MSVQESQTETDIIRAAYDRAWKEFKAISSLSVEEKERGPSKLMEFIQEMYRNGERDPLKICQSALGLMRNHYQLHRSRSRIIVEEEDVRFSAIDPTDG